MPEIWYGGFFMTVALHGMNYRYRFRVKGKRYFGLCVNCHTEEEALAFEAQERNRLLAEFYEAEKRSAEYAAQLQIEQEKIKYNRNVRALVENYRYVLMAVKAFYFPRRMNCFWQSPGREEPFPRNPADNTRLIGVIFWHSCRILFPISISWSRSCHCIVKHTFLI